jgi:hypothetical protein
VADALQYGLGQPLTKRFGDILCPPEDVDVDELTKNIVQKTGITLKG